jgi:hypothetical protein
LQWSRPEWAVVPGNEEVKVFILLGCGAASLGDWCRTFGDSIVVSSSRVKMSMKEKKVLDVMRRTEGTISIDISVS